MRHVANTRSCDWFPIIRMALAALVVVFLSGCDPTRTTTQTVRLKITNRKNATPAPNVGVLMKWSWDAAVEKHGKEKVTTRESWERLPWYAGKSDHDGSVRIVAVVKALDGERRRKTEANYDWFTGRTYVVKLENPNGDIEEISIEMTRGELGESKLYIIEIEEIGPAVYSD